MCLKVATLNCYRQSGFSSAKQQQISSFIRQHKLDVVHLQEINLDEDSFGESSISGLEPFHKLDVSQCTLFQIP